MKTRFDIWVDKMTAEYFNSKRYTMVSNPNISFCYDKRTGNVGIARRHPDDEPDFSIGKAIAYARCRGYEVPKQTVFKYFHDMKNGEQFYYFGGKIATYIGHYVDAGFVYHVFVYDGNLQRGISREYEVIK